MDFTLREAVLPTDYEAMAALLSSVRPVPVTAADLAEKDAILPPGSTLHKLIAVGQTGLLSGFAEAYRYPNTRAGKFYVNVVTDQAARRRGVGTACWRRSSVLRGVTGQPCWRARCATTTRIPWASYSAAALRSGGTGTTRQTPPCWP